MEFEYQVGELVCSKWNDDVYQVVKCLPDIPTENISEQGIRYYARRITIHKYKFKPEKAVLFHHSWLYKNKRTLEKFNELLTPEIVEYINDVKFEPNLVYYYFNTDKYKTAYFIVNKREFNKVKNIFENIPFSLDIKSIGEKELEKLINDKILEKFDITSMTKKDLLADEIVCRIDIYRYENDFLEPDNYLSPNIYRFFKVKKKYIK